MKMINLVIIMIHFVNDKNANVNSKGKTKDICQDSVCSYNGSTCISAVGKNINVCVEKGMGDYEYDQIVDQVLVPMAKEYRPDMIIVSCGLDAAIGDPIGEMNLTPPFYQRLFDKMMQIQFNTVGVLEGGYNPTILSTSLVLSITALLGISGSGQKSKYNTYDASHTECKIDQTIDKSYDNNCSNLRIPFMCYQKSDDRNLALSKMIALKEKNCEWDENDTDIVESECGYLPNTLLLLKTMSNDDKLTRAFHHSWIDLLIEPKKLQIRMVSIN